MRMWVYDLHTGGQNIPPAVRARIERRILDHANRHHSEKFTRIAVRFHGTLCYIDASTEPSIPERSSPGSGETQEHLIERLRRVPTHLCRIRYNGNEDRWSLAWYTYAHEKYEPGFFSNGEDHGTPEETFEASIQFL